MAEGTSTGCAGIINTSYSQKRRYHQKEKKKHPDSYREKKNVLKYGKLCEFPTFQHDKQTTSQLMIIFKKNTCIVPFRINTINCIGIAGFTHKSV